MYVDCRLVVYLHEFCILPQACMFLLFEAAVRVTVCIIAAEASLFAISLFIDPLIVTAPQILSALASARPLPEHGVNLIGYIPGEC